MGMLGLLPLWTIDFLVISDKAKPIDWFNKNMPVTKALKGAELDHFVANLGQLLKLV